MSGLRHPPLSSPGAALPFEIFIYLLHGSWEHVAQETGWAERGASLTLVLLWNHELPGTQSPQEAEMFLYPNRDRGGRLGR